MTRLNTLSGALNIVLAVIALDLNSFCAGACSSRYDTGFYQAGRCACVDYRPMDPHKPLEIPKRIRKPASPQVYDGQDSMHYSPADPDPDRTPPPTADIEF